MVAMILDAAVYAVDEIGGKRLDRVQLPIRTETDIFGNPDSLYVAEFPIETVYYEFPAFRMGHKLRISEEQFKDPMYMSRVISYWAKEAADQIRDLMVKETETRLESAIIRPRRER